jgi:signal-transduction protein with cAMP-binding, CBS, and nucleotidyltransferase domain
MLDNRISGLPVVDVKGAPVGILTEGDLLRRIETGTDKRHSGWIGLLLGPGRLAAEYTRSHAHKVGEVMTTEVVSVAPDTPLPEVVELMEERRIKRVPVVDGGKLVGIVSRANLVAALAGVLAKERGAALSDDDIRRAILAEIDKQPWGPRESVDATVTDGVVELHGTILDERERAALIVAAENLPGVKSVRDKLVWVEPNSGMVIPSSPGN